MKNIKTVCEKIISLIIIFCFILNIVSLDRAYSLSVITSEAQDNLAASSGFDDLTGTELKDIANITFALQANLLNSGRDVIDVNALKDDLLLEEKTAFNPANMHFVFSGDGMKALTSDRVIVKCKVKNEGNPLRIYYVVFSTTKQGEGFPMEVHPERKWEKLREGIASKEKEEAREAARKPDGKFGKQEGKSTDDAWKLICSSPSLAVVIKARSGFSKDNYIAAWKKAYPNQKVPADSTVLADLDGLLEEYKDRSGEVQKGFGYLTKEIRHGKAWYYLTDKGKAVRTEDSLALREAHDKMVERESQQRKGSKDLVKVEGGRTMPIHAGELSDQPKLPATVSETVASVVQAKYGGDRLVTATMRNEELVNGLLETESFHDKNHLRQTLINAGFADPTAEMKRDVRHFVQTVDARNPEAAAPQVMANVLLDRGGDEDSRAIMTFANEIIKYTDPELSENLEGLLKASGEVQLKCFKWLFERIIKEAEAAYGTEDYESQSKHILIARLILKHINKVISNVDDKNWVALRTHILMTFAERISAEWRGEKKGLMAVFLVLYPDISRQFFLSVDRNFTALTELSSKDEGEKLFAKYGGYEKLAESFEVLLSFSCLAWSDHNDEHNFFDYLVSRHKHASKNVKACYLSALRFGIIPRKVTGEIYEVEDVKQVAEERLRFVLENTVDLAAEKSPIIQKKVKNILIHLPGEFISYMEEDSRYMGLDYDRRLLLSEIILHIGSTEPIMGARERVLPFVMHEINLQTEDNIEIHKKIFGCSYFTRQLIEKLNDDNGRSVRKCIMEGYHELKKNDLTAKNCKHIMTEFGMPSITEAYEFFRHRISLDYDKAVGVLYLAGHVASAFQAETAEDKKAIDRMTRTVMQHALDSTRTKRESIKAYDILREKISRTYRDLEGLEKQVQEITEANSELTAKIKDLKDEKSQIKDELFFLDRTRQHLNGTLENASLLIDNITATYLTLKVILKRLPMDIMKALGFFNKLRGVELPDPSTDKKTYDEQVKTFIEDTKPDRRMKLKRAKGTKDVDLNSEETFTQKHSIREWILIRRRMRQRLAEKYSNLTDMESDIWEKNKRLVEIDEEMGDLEEKQVEIARDYVELKNEYGRKSKFLKRAEEKLKPAAQAKMEESFKVTKDMHSVLRLFLSGPSTSRKVVSETARVFTGGAAIESTSRMLSSGKEETKKEKTPDKETPDASSKPDDEEEIVVEEGKSDGEVILTLLALSKDQRFSELVSIDAVKEILSQHLEYQSKHGIFKDEVIAELNKIMEFLDDGTHFPKESKDELVQKIKNSMWASLRRQNQMEASAAVAERLDKTRAKVKTICSQAVENVRAGAGTADALIDYMEAFLNATVKNENDVRRLLYIMIIISRNFGCNAAIEATFSRLSGVAGKYFIQPKDTYYEVKTVDEWDAPEEGLVKSIAEDGRILIWEYTEEDGRKVKGDLVSIEEEGIVTTYRWDAPSPLKVVIKKGDGDPKIRKYRFGDDGKTKIIYALNPAELVMEEYRDYFRAIQLLKKTVYECQQESHKIEEGYGWDTEANDAGLRYFLQLFNSEDTSPEVKAFAEKMLYLSVFQEWINTWKVQADPMSRAKIVKLNVGFSAVLGSMLGYLESAPEINIAAAQMDRLGNHTPVWVVEMSYRFAKRVCGIFESKHGLSEQEAQHALKVLERMEAIIADDVIIVEEEDQGEDVAMDDAETGVYVKIAIKEALLHLRKHLKIYTPPSQKVLPSSTINLRLPFSAPGQGLQSALTEGDTQNDESETTKQSVIGDIFKDTDDVLEEEAQVSAVKDNDTLTALANKYNGKLKGELVDVLDPESEIGQEEIIGQIDRNIAESAGLFHRTSNIIIMLPSGEIVLQQRAGYKTFGEHWTFYGGHVKAFGSTVSAVDAYLEGGAKEFLEESGIYEEDEITDILFDEIRKRLIPVGRPGEHIYDIEGDNNKERRALYVITLNGEESERLRKKADSLEKLREECNNDSKRISERLKELNSQPGEDGRWEVMDIAFKTVDETLEWWKSGTDKFTEDLFEYFLEKQKVQQEIKRQVALTQIEGMMPLAQEVGVELSRPILDKNYTLVTTDDLYRDEDEHTQDIREYGSIFNLERIKPAKPATVVTRILEVIKAKGLDPENVMVQLPKVFSLEENQAELGRLVNSAPGIKFMIIDTEGLKDEENSADYRRNIYSMMLLARKIDKDTLEGSKLHRLLEFFISSTLGDENKALISGYMDALIKNDATLLVQTVLSYKPAEKYDVPEYGTVAATLIAA